jgi:hypothetical protein
MASKKPAYFVKKRVHFDNKDFKKKSTIGLI